MPKFEVRELEWIANAVVRFVLWVEPAGGQAVARRNAWSSLVEDNRRRVERLELERALARTAPDSTAPDSTALQAPEQRQAREMALV